MASEIERKFLLDQLPAELEQNPAADIEQGYLTIAKDAEVRVRRRGESFTLTFKRGDGEEREEAEVELDSRQFHALWKTTEGRRLTKRRYLVSLGDGLRAEVDVYFGPLAGLRVVEVEFPSREAAASFQAPSWFGREVTGDKRYANQALAIGGIPNEVSGDSSRTYGLKQGEGLAPGTKRIAGGRIEKALERLRGIDSGETEKAGAVHGARKDMKKLRTLLRLLRDELPGDVCREEKERYRDAARKLSASRDAEVKLQTLARLGEQAEELPEEAVGTWRQFLEGDRKLAANTDEAAFEEAVALIEGGRDGIESWRLEGEEWKAIGSALTRIYRRGRRAMKAARKDPSEDNFHQWRKRAKDLRYALELLERAWKEQLEATAAEADRLGELLGDHHDLAVLREDLHERRLGVEETRRLEAAIDAQQEQLAAGAFELGRRLYAERPKEFGRRLGRYWEAWRG
ncbi:MAG: CHAD domain-containing protein [Actinomycetota bacterium]|nr:CHAD domain-containing protein [Actinomycetota bacterium]